VRTHTATLQDGTGLWKLFSNDDVRPHLTSIFLGLSTDPADTVVQHWNYTFPVLSPVNGSAGAPSYQPISLADGVWYVNAMESVASAMEGSIIAGRNLALTLAQQSRLSRARGRAKTTTTHVTYY
jgi:hypothetical protein